MANHVEETKEKLQNIGWEGGISTMYKCPLQNQCFLLATDDLLNVLKKTIEKMYCNRDYEKCIRYQLYRQGRAVPKNLLPNDRECLTIE